MGSSLIDGHAPAQPVKEDELNQSEKSYYEDGDDTDGEDGKRVNQPETRPVEVVAADDYITSVARGGSAYDQITHPRQQYKGLKGKRCLRAGYFEGALQIKP